MLLLVTVVHYIQVLSRSYFASKFWLKCFLDNGVENPKQHKNIGFEQKLTIPKPIYDKIPLPWGALLFDFQTFSSFFSYQFTRQHGIHGLRVFWWSGSRPGTVAQSRNCEPKTLVHSASGLTCLTYKLLNLFTWN